MKKLAMIIGLAIGLPLALQGCGSEASANAAANKVSTLVLHEDITLLAGRTSKGFRVFSSQEDYEDELQNYSADEPMTVNFSNARVVLLDAGQRSSAGYSIEVEEAREHDTHIRLKIVLRKPGSGCMVAQVVTNPYQFVAILSTKEVLIHEELVIRECQ